MNLGMGVHFCFCIVDSGDPASGLGSKTGRVVTGNIVVYLEPSRASHGPVLSVLNRGTIFIEAFGDLYLQRVEEIFLISHVGLGLALHVTLIR